MDFLKINLCFSLLLCFFLDASFAARPLWKGIRGPRLAVRQAGGDPCTDGNALVDAFSMCGNLAMNGGEEQLNEPRSEVIQFLEGICTNWETVLTCFENVLETCDDSLKTEAMTVARETTIVCENNEVNAGVLHMVNMTHQEALATWTPQCFPEDEISMCVVKALAISGLGLDVEGTLSTATPTEIAAYFNSFFEAQAPCQVAALAKLSDSCQYWREAAMISFGYMLLPPTLGLQMPFSNQELDDMFEMTPN